MTVNTCAPHSAHAAPLCGPEELPSASPPRVCLWCGKALGQGKRTAVYCSTSCRSRMSQVKRALCVNAMRLTWGWTEDECADELEAVGMADVTVALELHGTIWNSAARRWERQVR